MKVVIDIEADALENPTQIWVIVCKDIDTEKYYIFRENDKDAFIKFARDVSLWIGHHVLGYDFIVLERLWKFHTPSVNSIIDTLILSRLVDYDRDGGHSLDQFGRELGFEKGKNYYPDFFKRWSQPLEDYCVRDVDLSHKVYLHFLAHIRDPSWRPAIELEQSFQLVLNSIHDRGFAFNSLQATNLLERVKGELNDLDTEMEKVFLPRAKPVREVHPKLTKYGTLNRSDFRFVRDGDLSEYNGGPFTRIIYQPFNAASSKQVVDVLHSAGWSPTEKTDTHIRTQRELAKIKRSRNPKNELELVELSAKLEKFAKYGYKVNEVNLATLPSSAPPPARLLAKRILRESRRRTLTEWLSLLSPDGRIHGVFQGIGAWTHRMAHQKPNLANIPNAVKISDGSVTYLGKELRSLWTCTSGRVLWGVDAEAIQLRIFAHLINDPELNHAILTGKKSKKTDPHSLNQRYFGSYCKTRNAAKHSLYAIFFGGGPGKIAHIMACTQDQAKEAIENLKQKYPSLARLEREQFPLDAKRGYFIGLDGRKVVIPGLTVGDRKHLCMSGYLQCGEAIVIKLAATRFFPQLSKFDSFLVDIVHDEYQGESPNKEIALEVCQIVADSIKWAGEELKLNCPMAGSYFDEDHQQYTIGANWYQTH